LRGGKLVVDDVPDPVAGPGQVLVETLACGICGSDLHVQQHFDRLVAGGEQSGNGFMFDPAQDVVMGHEFSARVLEAGAGVTNVREGDVIVGVPLVVTPDGRWPVGYSNEYPGGYGERMVLTAALCYPVPNGLDPRHAALTEPMGVGVHAVSKSGVQPGQSAVVLGSGPIGLATIAALRLAGVAPIVASDPSFKRRELAAHMGAHEVVDPRQEPAIEAWQRVDGKSSLAVFEASGVRGLLAEAMQIAPPQGKVLVVGVCTEPDTVFPMIGIYKELTVQFSLGSMPDEFQRTLQLIADGEIDVAPLITGAVGIEGVASAFEDLHNPEEHAKILVEPSRN
jgi:threonine dehydrogenase-like Zn-dependent dehydrogenase